MLLIKVMYCKVLEELQHVIFNDKVIQMCVIGCKMIKQVVDSQQDGD